MIYVYTQPNCQACQATIRLLSRMHADYEEREVSEHPDILALAERYGYRQAPIVVADEAMWSGYNRESISRAVEIQKGDV